MPADEEKPLKLAARIGRPRKPPTLLTEDMRWTAFTMQDFVRLSPDERLGILATATNEIMKAATLLVMRPGIVYTDGRQLRADVFSFFGVPESRLDSDRANLAKTIAVNRMSYYNYLDIRRPNNGSLTRINLATSVSLADSPNGAEQLAGYALNTFGAELKPFVGYILAQFAEYGIDPKTVFGSTRGALSPVRATKMLVELSKGVQPFSKVSLLADAQPGMSHTIVSKSLHRLSGAGLVDYASNPVEGGLKHFLINQNKLTELLATPKVIESWKEQDIPKDYKRQLSTPTLMMAMERIHALGCTETTTLGLSLMTGKNEKTARAVLGVLAHLKVVTLYVKITELGTKVAETILVPMTSVAENPSLLGEYSATLSAEQRQLLLSMYSKRKASTGQGREEVYGAMPKDGMGITPKAIAAITGINLQSVMNRLNDLKESGLIVRTSRGHWFRAAIQPVQDASILAAAKRDAAPQGKLAVR